MNATIYDHRTGDELREALEDIEEMLAAYIRHERIMTQLEGNE